MKTCGIGIQCRLNDTRPLPLFKHVCKVNRKPIDHQLVIEIFETNRIIEIQQLQFHNISLCFDCLIYRDIGTAIILLTF